MLSLTLSSSGRFVEHVRRLELIELRVARLKESCIGGGLVILYFDGMMAMEGVKVGLFECRFNQGRHDI